MEKRDNVTQAEIQAGIRFAMRDIRKENRGLPYKVQMETWRFWFGDGCPTLQIAYTDGAGQKQFYNMAM